jgi:LacI family transcriptional regulator
MLIAEIAEMAKVSPATVSRAINQPDLVAAASLARILAVMKKHNYVPTPLNRRRGPKARLAEMRRIGVWFVGARADNPNLSWFLEQFHHIQPSNSRNRVDVRLLYSNTPDDLPVGIAAENLHGVIIQGMEPSAECLAKLRDVPHVWFMTRRSSGYPGDYVEPNNEENGRMAANYLNARGHTCVAVITTDPEYSAIARRIRAFEARAAELGMETHSILGKANPGVSYLEVAPLHGESDQLVRRLVASKPRPTGLYLPVDHFCGAFFRALREAGPRPGRDIEAILGNFNPIIYHNLDHFPAAIDINLETLVRKVIDQLLWRIENPSIPARVGVTVSPTLIEPAAPRGQQT